MKKMIMTAALAVAAFASASAQLNDVQSASLSTAMPFMIALRPYNASLPSNNQNLSATVTNATAVLTSNNFDYTSGANPSYNGLAYRVYSNYSYRVTLKAQATGSNDELNGYVTFKAETLPSPENGLAPWASNGNADHTINAIGDGTHRLSEVTAAAAEILANNSYSTGIFPAPLVYDPVNTDFAAFGIKFVAHPGFSILPGNYTTNLTITATTP